MAFDALSLSILCDEFAQNLTGGKITKIYQPEKDELVFFIFNKRTYKLLMSANASVNRIHLTERPTDNPSVCPAFCMLLRKHLTNATITGVAQQPLERALCFDLQNKNELGYGKKMHLVFELTGKTSNVVLTDENFVIADTLKHLPQDLSSKRVLLAGAKYEFLPPQEKIAPFDFTKVRALLQADKTPLRTLLSEKLLGVSQETIGEVLYGVDENDHTDRNVEKVVARLAYLRDAVASPRPNVVYKNGSPDCVCPFDYQSKLGEKVFRDSLNAAHDEFYYETDKYRRFRDKAKSISTIVKNAVSRTEKKIAAQKQGLLEAQDAEKNKIFGDLLLANIHLIKYGASSVEVCNYYEESCPNVVIPLEVNLTAQQNAQKYYKKYRKQKSTVEHNSRLIEENEKLLDYYTSVKKSLDFCNEQSDLDEIRAELVEHGLIKEKKTANKQHETPSKPLVYDVGGYTVYVGKNNVQNNFVTFKIAKPADVWLHASKMHSAHAVIVNDKNGAVPDEVVVVAAEIVAFFSEGRYAGKVPVDFTEKAVVKKPPKAPTGFVVYDSYNTLLVTPNEHSAQKRT